MKHYRPVYFYFARISKKKRHRRQYKIQTKTILTALQSEGFHLRRIFVSIRFFRSTGILHGFFRHVFTISDFSISWQFSSGKISPRGLWQRTCRYWCPSPHSALHWIHKLIITIFKILFVIPLYFIIISNNLFATIIILYLSS